MASATKKASSLTTLKIGNVEVPVGLFSTVAKPGGVATFDTAGPNGGVLKAQSVARPVPVDDLPVDVPDEPVHSDPLADDEPSFAAVAPDESRWTADDVAAVLGEGFPPGDEPAPVKPDDAPVSIERMSSDPEPPLIEPEWAQARATVVDGVYGRELVEEGSGVVVAPADVRRGVRLEDGRFIDCTARLAQIEKDTHLEQMQVIGFVDSTQVARYRVKGSQYVGAADETAPRALRIMLEGLKRTRRMALVKLTKRSRQTLGVIGVARGVLILLELVWAEDFREPPARALRVQKEAVSEREVAMFADLVQAMAVPMSALDELRDDAIALREELRAQAEAGEIPEDVVDAEVVGPADDLMAQLEASLAAAGA
jgi:DNA end-binding protein Ku